MRHSSNTPHAILRRSAIAHFAWILGLIVGLGCKGSADSEPPAGDAPAATSDAAALARQAETWEVTYHNGRKIGYGRQSIETVEEDGRTLTLIESEAHLEILRAGQPTEIAVNVTCAEGPTGELVRFESETLLAKSPVTARGEVQGNRMTLETVTAGTTSREEIDWSSGIRGVGAEVRSLDDQPLEPGESRTIRVWDASLLAVMSIELTAKDVETVELLDGSLDLLRIEARSTIDGGDMPPTEIVHWVDPQGVVQKSRIEPLGIESFRVTKETALEEFDPAADLLLATTVPLEPPLKSPHETERVIYRVRLEGQDPAEVFANTPSQQVRTVDSSTAEITVQADRLADASPDEASGDERPEPETREPNPIIQSDDSRIVAMAREAAGDETDSIELAAALERYVYETIDSKNFSQAFASAAEVAESREGDCTEHAVLLAALCRARGLPARVAIGLVALNDGTAFGYHMWTECYLDGGWRSLDATLGQGGIAAAHLKLADSSLKGASPYAAFMPVVQVLGKLEIEVVEAD